MAKQPDPQWVQAPDGTWHPIVQPPQKKESHAGALAFLLCMALGGAVLVIGFLGTATKSDADKAKDRSEMACTHFRNIAGDVRAGILTGPELRAKLIEVNDNATTGTPEVKAAATGMLAGITSGDDAVFATNITKMDEACKDAGH